MLLFSLFFLPLFQAPTSRRMLVRLYEKTNFFQGTFSSPSQKRTAQIPRLLTKFSIVLIRNTATKVQGPFMYKFQAKYFQLPTSVFSVWTHRQRCSFILISSMILMVNLSIKAPFWNGTRKRYKWKEWYITRNYHFNKREYSSFLNLIAIYIYIYV